MGNSVYSLIISYNLTKDRTVEYECPRDIITSSAKTCDEITFSFESKNENEKEKKNENRIKKMRKNIYLETIDEGTPMLSKSLSESSLE